MSRSVLLNCIPENVGTTFEDDVPREQRLSTKTVEGLEDSLIVDAR